VRPECPAGACGSQARLQHVDSELGAAAVEFALVLPLFLFLIYGMVHYGLLFSLSLGMTSAANDGARAAVAVDPEETNYETLVTERARAAVVARLAWLSDTQKGIVLGASGELVAVTIDTDASLGAIVRVELAYPSYPSQPILPLFTLPVLGSVPPVPDALGSTAVSQL